MRPDHRNKLPQCLTFLLLTLLFGKVLLPQPVQATQQTQVMQHKAITVSQPLTIFVSIPPQAAFVKAVGGKRVAVESLIPRNQNPATYAPTPRQLSRLTQATLYFRTGLPFEKRLLSKLKQTHNDLTIIDLQTAIQADLQPQAAAHQHHDDTHAHHPIIEVADNQQPTMDPHSWLNPRLVIKQIDQILTALSRFDPTGTTFYQQRSAQFTTQLQQLDQRLKTRLQPFIGQTLYVFHPAYGYFCQAYGLKQVSVLKSGKRPSPKHLADTLRAAHRAAVRVLFIQPQFAAKSSQAIADALRAQLVELDPLAPNYLTNMEKMANAIATALENR